MTTKTIQAIDVHAHYGPFKGKSPLTNKLMSGGADFVVRRARLAHTQLTIVSPLAALLPRFGGDPISANIDAAQVVTRTEGLLQWVVIDPLKPHTYVQAEEMLCSRKCVGIKIHPEEHGYPIAEHGRAVMEFAAKHQAIVQSHSGEQNSMPVDFAGLANDFPEVTIIISHLGCGWDDDLSHQVRAIQASKHGNLYTDTSSSKSITSNLLEWAVAEVGAEHILYGTDSPLYYAPMQRARIDYADISDQDKRLILRDNAARLFALADQLGAFRGSQEERT